MNHEKIHLLKLMPRRNLPKRYDEIEDAAFLVRLEGLKPISKTVDFTKRGRFRNTVSR